MPNKILRYIEKFKEANGYHPSQAQIAARFATDRQRIHYYFKEHLADILNTDKYPEYKRYFA
jgi:hypothetical protein